ncbi:MAG: heme exporter protein CcmB [Bacteroidia bacterium]|nr:heme exporter protein CcmB [Bacteroidia bacterium]
MKHLFFFVKKEFTLDFRQSTSIASILAYLLSVLFSVSLLFKNKHTAVSYSSVFLIIFLFTSILSSYRNFIRENSDNGLFNYIMYSPFIYVVGKMVYLIVLNFIVGLLLIGLFIMFNGNLIEDYLLFILNLFGLSVGLGALLTLVGYMSSKTDGNFALMSIMSFPLLLPLMIISAKLSVAAIQGISAMAGKYVVSLFSMDVIIISLSVILFQQIWTE